MAHKATGETVRDLKSNYQLQEIFHWVDSYNLIEHGTPLPDDLDERRKRIEEAKKRTEAWLKNRGN